MIHSIPASSPRSCRSGWPTAVLFAVLAAALVASLSGCMRAGAGSTTVPGDARAGVAQVRPLVVLEKKMPDGRTVEVPLAEEYRGIRAAGVDGAAPPIPPSEMWPAQ
jgi:hypothetical protein